MSKNVTIWMRRRVENGEDDKVVRRETRSLDERCTSQNPGKDI